MGRLLVAHVILVTYISRFSVLANSNNLLLLILNIAVLVIDLVPAMLCLQLRALALLLSFLGVYSILSLYNSSSSNY